LFYPYDLFLPLWKVLISTIIFLAITLAVLYHIKKQPFLFTGWFWYLGTLIPVIGLIQLGEMAMADRYTYLPSAGIAIMLAWGISSLIKNEEARKKILFPSAIVVLAVLVVLTWKQRGYWENGTILWNHALRVTKDNYLAHNNLAFSLAEEGKFNEAIYHYNAAITIVPYYFPSYYGRGIVYTKLGQYQRAIADYNEAIRLKPNFAKAYGNRGFVYFKLGQYQRAIEEYNEVIRIAPEYAIAYDNKAFVYLKQGNIESGCYDARKACSLGVCATLETAKSKGICN
jgi:tetratricopeptide (TPR) repeat protein